MQINPYIDTSQLKIDHQKLLFSSPDTVLATSPAFINPLDVHLPEIPYNSNWLDFGGDYSVPESPVPNYIDHFRQGLVDVNSYYMGGVCDNIRRTETVAIQPGAGKENKIGKNSSRSKALKAKCKCTSNRTCSKCNEKKGSSIGEKKIKKSRK